MSVRRIISEKKQEFAVEAKQIQHDVSSDLDIKTIDKVRVLNQYDVEGITDEEYEKAKTVVFSEPPVDDVYDESADLTDCAYVLRIEALPGQYDQRADSAAQCVQFLTQKERPNVRSAKIVCFYGTLTDGDKEKIKNYLINPVECREAAPEKPDTLVDKFDIPTTVETVDGFITKSDSELADMRASLGLAMSDADLKFTQDFFKTQGRNPTITEIRVLDTYWSDHCRHTTFLTELTDIVFEGDDELTEEVKKTYADYLASREDLYKGRLEEKHICLMDIATLAVKKLKKDGKLADLDESEEINACSIKIRIKVDGEDKDYILMFKNETHNHPTEIEPFGGAATCLGGAIRDPLSGRSYVYQAMRVTGAGDPTVPVSMTLKGKLSQKKIVRTAAAGYSSYGNQIGLATGQVDEVYHPGYVAKRMEIGAVIAAAPAENIVRERPSDGDIVVLLGGRTGRDGIGGATGSSKAHDTKSVLTCGSEVQKGNPPTERKLQRLFRNPEVTKLIIRCNDFGAGGVSVAIGELAAGLEINLDAVPKKYEGLDGTEIAISESQERMAVVIRPADLDKFMAAADKENLEATVVARVTEEPVMKMVWNGNTIVDLPRSFIDTNGAKQYAKATVAAPDMDNIYIDKTIDSFNADDFASSLKGALNSLDGCSRKGLTQRFDSSIGAATALMPYGGKFQNSPEEGMAAKIPMEKGTTSDCSVMTYGFDPYFTEWNTYAGSYHAVVESLLKLLAMGSDPLKARLTFQEYFERMGSEKSWGKPLSALLGAYQAQLDFGTGSIGGKDSMSGSFNDIHVPPTLVSFAVGMTTTDKLISSILTSAGQRLYIIKCARNGKGFYKKDHVLRVFKAVKELQARGQVQNAAVVRASGVASRVATMCFGNGLGFKFSDKLTMEELFSKTMGAIIVAIPNDSNAIDKVEMAGGKFLGVTDDSGIFAYGSQSLAASEALSSYEGKLEPIFATKATSSVIEDIKPFTTDKTFKASPSVLTGAKPKVVIPVFPGTNCELDTARAFDRAGAEAEVFVIRNKSSEEITESLTTLAGIINKSNIVMLPGGFSAGDEPEGSGKFFAAAFRSNMITDAVRDLLFNRDGLMLGICNGFQSLIKLGLLPYGDVKELTAESPTLTFNSIGRHQNSYVRTKIMSNNSPWLSKCNVGEVYNIPISHGEGRFAASMDFVRKLEANGQIATCYVDINDNLTADTAFNPNGSICAIEGILSPDGRIFGKMGHSERYEPDLTKNIGGNKDQKIFESGVAYFK